MRRGRPDLPGAPVLGEQLGPRGRLGRVHRGSVVALAGAGRSSRPLVPGTLDIVVGEADCGPVDLPRHQGRRQRPGARGVRLAARRPRGPDPQGHRVDAPRGRQAGRPGRPAGLPGRARGGHAADDAALRHRAPAPGRPRRVPGSGALTPSTRRAEPTGSSTPSGFTATSARRVGRKPKAAGAPGDRVSGCARASRRAPRRTARAPAGPRGGSPARPGPGRRRTSAR